MIRERLAGYRNTIRSELTEAFERDHSAHHVGMSFALGLFVSTLPSGGLSAGLLAALAYWWSWVSVPAVVASVALLNPLVKPAIYVASFQLGAIVLGADGTIPTEATARDSVLVGAQQLVVGNLLIGVTLAVIGYVVTVHLTRAHRQLWQSGVPTQVASKTTILIDGKRDRPDVNPDLVSETTAVMDRRDRS